MLLLAGIFLLAASTRVELVDEVYQIPPDEWRYVELELRQQPAFVSARYEVLSSGKPLRLALLRKEDLEKLRNERPHGLMAATAPGQEGALQYHVRKPGQYVIVVDNRGGDRKPAEVRLRVALDFAAAPGPEVTLLAPRRQLAVILISFAVFFGIAGYAGVRLLRAVRR